MQKSLRALVAAVGFAGAAVPVSAADLVAVKAPAALIFAEPESYGYLGGFIGGAFNNPNQTLDLGLNAGWNVNQFLRLEATADRIGNFAMQPGTVIMANVIGQYPFGGLTPYVLGGFGYSWRPAGNTPTWDVGGGLRYAFTSNIDLDLRYRYLQGTIPAFGVLPSDNIVTLGATYRF